jgi:hypothetical protein
MYFGIFSVVELILFHASNKVEGAEPESEPVNSPSAFCHDRITLLPVSLRNLYVGHSSTPRALAIRHSVYF